MDENTVVSENLGLVYYQLHRCNAVNDDDALSYAMEGLLNAVRTYEYDRNIKFSTYASACIYNNIQLVFRQRAAKKRRITLLSYDEPAYDDGLSVAEAVPSNFDIEQYLVQQEQRVALNEAFEKVLSNTTGLSRRIIEAWRDSDFEADQQAIAKVVGTSQSYVSRILKIFRHKLTQEMEES